MGNGHSDAGPHAGALIREHRTKAGLTQRQLAVHAAISVAALRDIEQGRTTTPRPDTLASLATALELTVAERAELASSAGRARPDLGEPGEPADTLRVGLLGPLMAERNGQAVALGPARQRAMLGLLVLHAGAGLTRAAIVDALWGAAPPAAAVQMVQDHITRIRRLLAPGTAGPEAAASLLSWDSGSYLLAAGAVRSDLAEFHELTGRARQAVEQGDPGRAGRLYEQALRLWRGEALADVEPLRHHPAVTGLNQHYTDVVLEYADAAGAAGQHQRSVRKLEALARRDPLDERVHARLISALASAGQQAAALAVYENLRQRLDDELGIRPGGEVSGAYLRILRQDEPGDAGEGHEGQRAAGSVVPRQLPPDVRHFIGRRRELAALDGLLDQMDRSPETVVISTVGGTAGVGKTTLAVHWAHRVAGRFPGGQLYLNLRGFDPAGPPVPADQAIRDLLQALNVEPGQMPGSVAAQTGLYRSLLSGKRMLIVLDNARDSAQVRPLLPGSPQSLAIVTSRSQLTGLAATQDTRLIRLDVFSEPEAVELLVRRLGAERALTDPAAADQLARLCAGLPLALAIAAARAAASPDLPLAALAAGLAASSPQGRLDALDAGDALASVRTVLSWSYRNLSPAAARLFRLLGVHRGPDISGPAAASLAGVTAAQAKAALRELASASLITEHVPGRYAFHDLLRGYAAGQAGELDSDADRRAAVHRVLDHYVHSACRGALQISPGMDPIPLETPVAGVAPEDVTGEDTAIAWFEAEHPVLSAAVSQAASAGFDGHAWRLPGALADFFKRRGYWDRWAAAQRAALGAADRRHNRGWQARAHRSLGTALTYLGERDEALRNLRWALGLYQQLGDDVAQARVHQMLGMLFEREGEYRRSLGHARQCLSLSRVSGGPADQAIALNTAGWYHAQLGEYDQCLALCREALGLLQRLGDHGNEGATWDSIGYALHHLGRPGEAVTAYNRALALFRRNGDRYYQAVILSHLGDAHQAAGDLQAARGPWEQAVAIFGDLRHPDGDEVRGKLGALPADGHSPVLRKADRPWPA